MKRHSGLFEQLTSFEHLVRAFYRARKGSSRSPEAHAWFFHLERNVLLMQELLRSGAYMPSAYRYFRIYDPKERVISVAPFRDRVVHHALVMLMEPIYERSFIHDSYATRKNKGTHAALRRAQQFVRQYRWFFKTDVDGYFASIRQDTLLELLERKIKDKPFLRLTEQIIRNGGEAGRGLPIGNLTSQFLANVYLDPLDHHIKERLGIRGYLRYMDDFVLFSDDRQQVKAWRSAVSAYLGDRLGLHLKVSASFINQRSNGLRFLGARIFPQTIRIHPENLRRSTRRMRQTDRALADGSITPDAWRQSLESRWAYLRGFDSLALRRALAQAPLWQGFCATQAGWLHEQARTG